MNPYFFTAPFYFAFIWFKVQGLRFRVQGSRFRVAEGVSSGRYVSCFGTIGVIYDTSRPLEKGRAEGAGWIHEAV